MNIFTAVTRYRSAQALFAAAGLDLDKMIDAADETALQAHLATLATPAAPKAEEEKKDDEKKDKDEPVVETDEEKKNREEEEAAAAEQEEEEKRKEEEEEEAKKAALAKVTGQRVVGINARDILTAFADSGIKVTAADKAKGITAADIKTALKARVATAAAEELAKRGLARFPGSQPVADPANAKARDAAASLSGIDRVKANLAAARATV